MEIPLFDDDVELQFERIVLYPYPDLKRVWTRAWLTAVQDKQPNVELRVLNPDGTENTSVFFMSQTEQRIETTLHLRDAVPGATYRIEADLSLGLSETPDHLDHREFEMVLEFRNPEAQQPGFGVGVDWDELSRQAHE